MASSNVNFDDLLKQVPIADIASKFGVDEATAKEAVTQALPGLLGGMAVNASSDEGAAKLTSALKKHEGNDAPPLTAVDTADGEKIVKHVLGDKQEDVSAALGKQVSGGAGALIPKLLPILAPIVMAYLASRIGGGSSTTAAAEQSSSGGGLGDILGGLLGGGSKASSGGGLGDILGGLLGGGSSSKSGGGLGDILGGLLGK